MEPQESNATNNIENHNEQNQLVENLEDDEEIVQVLPLSPSKCSILKRFSDDLPNNDNHRDQPVSILKCKNLDNGAHKESSSSSLHITLPVTFSPSVIEHAHKRHGILKKRSSLDESEILYRRCRSPDVTFTENNYPEFRPILKNQRRSSLDEIVKRSLSPDPHPTSILKRKSSREDSCEDRLSPEPQGILKRKLGNTNCNSESGFREFNEVSEVRPILKKKQSREESSSSDSLSLEPRPILKKKSSTDSDEHDDKPKKTILKSRKHSQDEVSKDQKKLSSLRYRLSHISMNSSSESDSIRPILKQSNFDHVSRSQPDFGEKLTASCVEINDVFLRKRAQSMGHVYISNETEKTRFEIGSPSKRNSTKVQNSQR